MPGEVKAKGVNFVYFKKYVIDNHGDAYWKKLEDSMESSEKDLWEEVLVSGWYPFSSFKKAFFQYARLQGAQGQSSLPAVYEYIADCSLTTLYKLFFKVAQSPHFVLSNYPKLWSMFFDQGQVEALDNKNNQCTIRFVVPEVFLDWLPPACVGYTRKAVMLSGGRDVVVRERSRQKDGDLHVVTYFAEWK